MKLPSGFKVTTLLACVGVFSLSGCGGGGSSNNDSEQQQTAALQGQITGIENVAGVLVEVGNASALTDSSGFFVLESLVVPNSKQWLVKASKADNVTAFERVTLNDESRYSVSLALKEPDLVETVDLSQEQTIILNGNEIKIELPAGSVVGGGSSSEVWVTYGDPSTDSGRDIFPGDYTATNSLSQDADILLESIGFLDVSVMSDSGADLSELSEPALVTMKLPPIYQTGGDLSGTFEDGDTIAWWSFNETAGVWLREDADPATPEVDDAEVFVEDGALFARAKITHFSWWNLDQPISTHACVTVRVVDDAGNPRANQRVIAEGVSFQSRQEGITNAQGYTSVGVKRSQAGISTETFKLFAEGVNWKRIYDVTSASEGNVTTDILNSPTIEGSLKDNTGECVTLENDIVITFPGTISGTVKDANNQPAAGIVVYSSLGGSATTNANGVFTFKVPHNADIFVVIPSVYAKQVRTTEAEPTVTLEIFLSNPEPIIDSLSATPGGIVRPGDSVELTVSARDLEGETLSYQWAVTQGTLNTNSGTNVTWTAPAGSGSTSVTVTVSDGTQSVSETRTLRWNEAEAGDFTVTLLPAPYMTDVTIEGVTVILHGSDNRSIAQTVQTDANGVANFGLINRATVSYTVIEQVTNYNEFETTEVSSYIGVPNEPTFYISNNGSYQELNIYYCPMDERITIEARLTNLPNTASSLFVVGNQLGISELPAENEEFNIQVCSGFLLQSQIPLVAILRDENNSIIAHSQEIIPSIQLADVTFNMSNTPASVPHINNTGLTLDTYIYAQHEGRAIYNLPTYDGTLKLFSFHADAEKYAFVADSEDEEEGFEFSQAIVTNGLPSSVTFDLPAYSMNGNAIYDELEKRISWNLQNGSGVDSINIELSDYNNVTWTITLPSSYSSINLPDLPSDLAESFSLSNLYERSISFEDFTDFNGLENLYRRVNDYLQINGTDGITNLNFELGSQTMLEYRSWGYDEESDLF